MNVPAQRGSSRPNPAPIGENIARIRRARGLTQEGLAAAAEVSVDVIARLEQGRKQTARWHTLASLARALDVELSALIAADAGASARSGQAASLAGGGLLRIREAVTALGDIPGLADFADDAETPDLGDLRTSLSQAWAAYQRGEFGTVASAVPALIVDARRAASVANDADYRAAHAALATACHMAAGVTVTVGHEDLALLAVERAVAAAQAADSQLAVAAGAIFGSWILLRQGRYAEAERVAVRMAEQVEPSFSAATPAALATFGNLLINASAATVRAGVTERAAEYVDVAGGAALRHGSDAINRWSVFGPSVVAMTRVNNAVELGDFSTAVRGADEFDATEAGGVPATWRARYCLNVAYANIEVSDVAAALMSLTRARALAPEWVRYHPMGRAVVGELLNRVPRRASAQLRSLAKYFEVVG